MDLRDGLDAGVELHDGHSGLVAYQDARHVRIYVPGPDGMHKFKQDFVGREDISKYDAKVDENGQIILVTKDGKTKVETGLTPAQVRDEYPNEKDKDKDKRR